MSPLSFVFLYGLTCGVGMFCSLLVGPGNIGRHILQTVFSFDFDLLN